ncbi:glycosyl hydrolase family 61-domain-containing protein, partial [Cyathus striatus]
LLFSLHPRADIRYHIDIFKTFIAGPRRSIDAIRQPLDVVPVHDYLSNDIRCNEKPTDATETITVSAGEEIGFSLQWTTLYHQGPVAIYLGNAPGKTSDWDGSGKRWFKIAEWGLATYHPFSFSSHEKDTFTTTIPKDTPSGEYLVRIEQIALHLTGSPEFFISCAQIKVINGGKGNPSKVSIPGYIPHNDESIMVNIYPPYPTSYTCPGPSVWRGFDPHASQCH